MTATEDAMLVRQVGLMVAGAMDMFVNPTEEMLACGEPREANCEINFQALGQTFNLVLTCPGIAA